MDENKMIQIDFSGKMCEITSVEDAYLPEIMSDYVKMDMTTSCAGQISALCHQMPSLMTAHEMGKAYVVRWADGLPHELASFKDGTGFIGVTRGDGGKFTAMAHLYPMKVQAAVTYGLTAMTLVTSQYYLTEINQKMTMISRGIDKILEFLYGDKKAELLSEISFTKYAYQNFASIMEHEQQRLATIQSLQEARKTAIKDVEFYLADLYSTVHGKDETDVEKLVKHAFRIRECLEFSIQLYVMENVLEVYYSQNFDENYLNYIENEAVAYIARCEKQILGNFHALRMAVDKAKGKIGKQINKDALFTEIDAVIDELGSHVDPKLKKDLCRALESAKNTCEKPVEYCIMADGNIYLKSV